MGLVEERERIITNSCPVPIVLWQKFTSRTPGKDRVGSSTIVWCLDTPHRVLYAITNVCFSSVKNKTVLYGKCCMTHPLINPHKIQ